MLLPPFDVDHLLKSAGLSVLDAPPPPIWSWFVALLGLREYTPGVPPGKRDVPFNPQEFVPGSHTHFKPLGSLGPQKKKMF